MRNDFKVIVCRIRRLRRFDQQVEVQVRGRCIRERNRGRSWLGGLVWAVGTLFPELAEGSQAAVASRASSKSGTIPSSDSRRTSKPPYVMTTHLTVRASMPLTLQH